MKQLILITFFISVTLFPLQVQAHTPGIGAISGTILDQKLEEPIPYATVSLKTVQGELLTGTVSMEDGTFVIKEVDPGNYIIEVQFMGYKSSTKEIQISETQHNVEIGSIYLEEDMDQLEDVLVVAERSTIEQRIDRKIVNVGKDLTTTGAAAADIMNNLPSVSMDQDGNVALRGNQNVKILIDGKPTNIDAATLLRQIPTSSIKQIELITNPSAKHDPEGMSGIINIILHKNSNLGFNGNLSGGVSLGENIKSNGSLNMNYRKGKVNYYANLGANDRTNSLEGTILERSSMAGEHLDLEMGNTGYLAKLGIDYYLNDRNTLSFYTNQNKFFEENNGNFHIRYPQNPELNYLQTLLAEEENTSSTYNFNYIHDFARDGHSLELEIDYNQYTNDEDSRFNFSGPNAPGTGFNEQVNKDQDNTIANLDYVNPLNETTKLELGAEARIRSTRNGYQSSNVDLEDVIFDYNRNIYSLYATFGKQFDQWSYQLGARGESYEVQAIQQAEEIYDDAYFTLYPSGYISYTPGEKNIFQVSYTRRVDRPSLNQVNPVRQLSTPRLTITGNPELRPQFTNSVEFNYTRNLNKGSWSGALFYRLIEDDINQIMNQDPQNPEHMILTFHNSDNTYSYGLEFSGNFKPAPFWDLNANINLYSQIIKGYLGPVYLEKENTFYRLQANNSFKVSDQFRLQLFGMYAGPAETLQFELEDWYFINLGGRYSFWQDRASLSLNLNDVFNSQVQRLTTTHPVPQIARLKPDTRTLYIGFSYRFGGGENKALERKQRDDNTAEGGLF